MSGNAEASNAARQVFSTFELLEIILLHLSNIDSAQRRIDAKARAMAAEHKVKALGDIRGWITMSDGWLLECLQEEREDHVEAHVRVLRDLYRLQRVSTTFQTVITRSKPLRQKMYKKSKESDDCDHEIRAGVWGRSHGLQRDLNPVASSFDGIRPFQLPACSGFRFFIDKIENNSGLSETKVHLVAEVEDDFREQRCTSASWRNMRFSKKPMSFQLKLEARIRSESFHSTRLDGMELSAEATLGDIADEVLKAIDKPAELEPSI